MIILMWKGLLDMIKLGKYEVFFFLIKDGLLKIYVYGFNFCGLWGEVFVIIGD